jgi:MscS family membrane protein
MILLALLLPAALGTCAPAGSPAAPPGDSGEGPQDLLGRTTPRGTVYGFIRTAQREDYERAAQYLDSRRPPRAATELARQLKAVLDRGRLVDERGLSIDLDSLSSKPEGKLDDDLAIGQERVGIAKTSSRQLEIFLDRIQRGREAPIWLFSADSLRRIPELYEELQAHWIEALLPGWLVALELLGTPLWQWIAFLLAIPLAVGLAWPLNRLLHPLLDRLLRWLPQESEERLLRRLSRPLRLLVLAFTIHVGSVILALPLVARQFWTRVSATLVILAIAWILLRVADILAGFAGQRAEIIRRPSNAALLVLGRRLVKAAIFLTALLFLLYRAGVDLTAALAGLGLGGLAIAFSAQKTLENLFGGIMLISDQTLRVGDFCRIGEQMGTVEDIGLRATRLRTLDRTVLNIPNGQLATMNIENFAWRDKTWFHPVIALRYETSPEQLRYLLAEIRRLLYAHPKVETASARIRLVRLGPSSLDLEIFSYILESDYAAFLAVQEDLLLRILELVEKSGTRPAFPSTTAYLAQDAGLDPARRQAAESAVRDWRARGDLPFPDFPGEQVAEMRDALPYPPADSAGRGAGPSAEPSAPPGGGRAR